MDYAHKRASVRIHLIYIGEFSDPTAERSPSLLAQKVEAAGFTLVRQASLRDDAEHITEHVREIAAYNRADAIILTGGTGIGRNELTYDALEVVLQKRIDGFGEAFRRLWFEKVGPIGILSRATAGVIEECVIFSIPSHTAAVELALDQLILPILEQTVDLALGRVLRSSIPIARELSKGNPPGGGR